MKSEASRQKMSELAAKYERDGFEVLVEPDPRAVPFELGGYRPDVLASRGSEHHIVAVRDLGTRLSVDRFQNLAEEIGRHEGWHFILVTSDDLNPGSFPAKSPLLSWEQLRERWKIAARLVETGPSEAALVYLWALFEGMLRLQAHRIALPVERFPTEGLIKHMYSHGELSMRQYEWAMEMLDLRNDVAHGFAADDVADAAAQTLDIIPDLFAEWSPQSAAA
jgi:hypothetical protein